MSKFNRKTHWENIYRNKGTEDQTWYQKTPAVSLSFLKKINLPKTARIIDIGGGDSTLVDHLLKEGFKNISVLDISQKAISKTKNRLGSKATMVNWIVSDAVTFKSNVQYDFWHDRATFHFLTDEDEITSYLETINRHLKPDGHLLIGTFSDQGPTKCSGIDIRQYTETSMSERLKKYFTRIECINLDHQTPKGTVQNFIFCSFRKLH